MHVSCPSVACVRPSSPPGECCPVCTGMCLHRGKEYQSGSSFTSPSDSCSSCYCLVSLTILKNESEIIWPWIWFSQINSIPLFFSFFPTYPFIPSCDQNEVVNCQKRPCPVRCSHPVPSDTCCPVCDSCLYESVVHSHSQTFKSSSNPCQRCTCVRGTVTCVPHVCPPTSCVRPVTKPGRCCPECTGRSWTVCVNGMRSLTYYSWVF